MTTGLRPFAISPHKLYATWGDAARWQGPLERWAREVGCLVETQVVNGGELLRVGSPPRGPLPAEHRARRLVPPVLWPAVKRVGSRLGAR